MQKIHVVARKTLNKYLSTACFITVLAIAAVLLAAKASSAADNRFAARPELATSSAIGRMDPAETVYFAFAFPVHHQAALDDRINRIYNPKDPLYRQYMTPSEFADAFGPSEQEYDAVAAYAQRCGFTITDHFANRMMLGVKAPAAVVESAFGVHMMYYQAKDGHSFRSPDGDLHVDPSVAPILLSVFGLDDFRQWKPASMPTPVIAKGVTIRQNGYTGLTNPIAGGLTPTGIRTAYGLGNSPLNGSGQTIGIVCPNLIDLNDIQAWEQYYGIPTGNVQIQVLGAPCEVSPPTMVPNTGSFSTASQVTFAEWQGFTVSIYYTTDGSNPQTSSTAKLYNGTAVTVPSNGTIEVYATSSTYQPSAVNIQGFGTNAGKAANNTGNSPDGEPTLDIESQLSMAPGATVIAYQSWVPGGPYIYSAIASQGTATSVSASYPGPESPGNELGEMAEYSAFQEMAAQGQSMFAASGDAGSENVGGSPLVEDPASQPYLTAVGGTTNLITNSDGTYNNESTWAGSGGGVSVVWPMPGYQANLVQKQSGGPTGRNVPDVAALAGSPGISIYFSGGYSSTLGNFPYASGGVPSQYGWSAPGGTSVATPLWAGFTALVNQERYANGFVSPVGFLNYALYRIAHGGDYINALHDIKDGYSNGLFKSIAGYDCCTGLGSMNGTNLIDDLAATGGVGGQVGYTVTTVSTPGAVSASATGIDDDGNVAGNTDYSVGAFFLPAGGSVQTIADELGGTQVGIAGLSIRSFGAGDYNYTGQATDSSGNYHGYLYSPYIDFMQDLGYLSGATYTDGVAINDQPQVAGYSGNDVFQDAVSYTSGLTKIPPIGGSSSSASGINDFGEVVGTTAVSSSSSEDDAFVWAPPGDSRLGYMVPPVQYGNGMTDLGEVSGSPYSTATAINDWDQVAGWGGVASGSAHALLWTYDWVPSYTLTTTNGLTTVAYSTSPSSSEIYADLDPTDSGDSYAYAMNDGTYFTNDASVVGSLYPTSGATSAFIYTPTFPLTDLNSLTTAPSGCTITGANAINDLGSIAGQTTCGSTTNAAVLNPITLQSTTAGAQSGSTIPLTVTISSAAPPGTASNPGITISLVSSAYQSVSVPSVVTISPGATSAIVDATVASSPTVPNVAITATYGSKTQVAHILDEAPTGLTATAGNTEVVLNWNAMPGATSYNVYVSNVSGSENVNSPTFTTTTNVGYDYNVTNNQKYYFKVAAVDAGAISPLSSEVSATPFVMAAPTLIATPGNEQVILNWTAPAGATGYGVIQVVPGGETLLANTTTPTYTVNGLTNNTPVTFNVYATNSITTSNNSNNVIVTPTAVGTDVIAISCGGLAASPYVADVDFAGGAQSGGTKNTINTTAVPDPAPQEVYQHGRYGASTYTIGGLNAGAGYTVRLHFDEYSFNAAGSREFNVSINGAQVLTNYDIWENAGGEYIANVQSFSANANSSGQIVIAFTNGPDNNAIISGIEIQTTGGSPPGPPDGIQPTPGNTQIALTWGASSGATSYTIYRSTTSGGETSYKTGVTTTSYTDTGLTNGVTYYYTVAGVNSFGTSASIGPVSATPTAVPGTPTNLTATAGNALVTLNWTAASGDVNYSIYRSTTSGGEGNFSTSTTTSYTDAEVVNGITYYYEVLSSSTGGVSGLSSQASATPTGPPPAPTSLGAGAGTGQVELGWTGSTGATSYNIYRATTSGGEGATAYKTGVTTTAYTDTAVTNGTTYYYTVAAVDSHGTSAQSNQTYVTPNVFPGTPTNLTATAGNAQVILNWTAATAATVYYVYRSTTSGGEVSYSSSTTSSFTDTGLTNGTTYYYEIAGGNEVGESVLSSPASATPSAGSGVYINCGGPAVSPFVADTDFSGGATIDHANTISTTGVTNPAPVAVYQSGRDDNFSYTIPGFTASSSHTVRLHFCETYFNAAGDRTFNVSINGTQVLTDFDIWKTAGAENQALIEQFTENANTSGQYVITFTSVVNNALVSGIEIH